MDGVHNVILIDFPIRDEWHFKKDVCKTTNETWNVLSCTSNQLRTNLYRKVVRYIKYFWLPFSCFVKRKHYDKIIAWQQFYGLVFAFFCRSFRVKKVNDLTVMTFIYKKKKGLMGATYDSFMRFIVTSAYVDRFIVFTSNEKKYYSEYFGVPETKFVCMPLGIEDISSNYQIEDNGRFLAAGRSNRDYDFLIKALEDTSSFKVDIICDTLNYTAKSASIRVYTDVSGKKYFEKLSQCHAVIVPLKDENISSGQLVILQAMMMGKPLVVTKSKSIEDYVEDGKTALVIDKDTNELLKAIDRLDTDIELKMKLIRNAKDKFSRDHSLMALGEKVGAEIVR